MKLISCHYCGIVLDLENIEIPKPAYDDDYLLLNTSDFAFDDLDLPLIECSVCERKIISKSGEKP